MPTNKDVSGSYRYERMKNQSNDGNKSRDGSYRYERIIQRKLPEIGESLNSSINNWLKKNESFYTSYNDRIGRYQDKDVTDWSYEADSSDWLSSLTTQKGNLEKEASEIKTWLDQYKDYLDKNYYNSVVSALNGNISGYGDIISQATDINKHWSNWDTEDAYNEWVTQQKDYNEKLNYDLEAGRTEIDRLQLFVDQWDEAASQSSALKISIAQKEHDLQYGHFVDKAKLQREINDEKNKLAGYEQWLNQFDGATAKKDLVERRAYFTNAERIQKAAELASVADVNSENYDVEFDKYANQGMSFTNPSINEAEKGNVRVNKAVYARDNADMIAIGEVNGGGSNIVSYYHSYMTDEEVRTYSYYFGKGDDAKAEEYLASLEETLKARHGQAMAGQLIGKPALEYAFGVAAGLDQFTSGVKGMFADDYTPTTATQVASGIIREDLADTGAKLPDWLGGGSLGQVGYDIITTTSNMLPSILASVAVNAIAPGAGAFVGTGLLGASAGGNAKVEMLNLGYSKEQANAYGVMVGLAEAGMEYLLGGISKLGGKASGGLTELILSKVDNAFARAAIKIGSSMASEGLEEGLQTVIEPWLKEMATGVDWDDPSIDEVLYSSLLGALSAFGLEGAGVVAGEVNTYKRGKTIQNVYAGVEKLQNIGTTFSADTVAYKIASKVNAQTDAYTIGRLLKEVGGTISEQNVTDITNGLVNRGVPLKEAKKLAKQYQAILNQNMNVSDVAIAILEATSPLADVLREEIVEKNTTVLQRTRQYGELINLADEVANRKKSKKGKNAKTSTTASEASIQQVENASVTENATSEENATENEFETSVEGKTIVKETGKAVNIEEIVSNDEGNLMVKLDNGETVNARDLAYATAEEGLLYEMAAKMGVDPNTAKALIKAYNPASGVKAQTYAIDIPLAYEYGKIGNKKGLEKLNLTPEQSATAYVLGRDNAKAEANSQSATLRESLKQAAEKAETTTSEKKQVKGKVRFEYGAKAKGKAQRHIVTLAKVLSNAMGIDFYFYDSTIDGTPESQSNGYFNSKDNSIHLDLQNAMTDAKTIAYSMSHELVHFIKKWSPAKFKVFADFLMEQYGEHGVDTDAMLQRMMGKLGTDDVNEAFEEMVCEACEKMLLDSNAAVKLAQLRAKDAGLVEKIKAHILDILNKIRAEYKKYSPSSEEAQALDKMGDVMEKFYSLFEDMAVDAAQTYQEAVGLNAESVVMSKDGTIKMQMKQYEQTGRTTLYNYLREQYGESDAKNLISTIDNIYNVLKEVKQNEALSVFSNWQDTEVELDEEGHPIFTTSINNGDYELNQDFSRVCKKRRQLDFVLNMLAEDPEFEASNLTKQDFVKINKAIKAHGFEIACALCFVDSKRFRQAEWADSFANTWNDILNAIVKDSSKLTPFNFATKTPNISDDGIEIDTSREVTYRKWSDGKEDVKNRRTYESFDQILAKDQDGKWLEGNTNVRTIATLLRDHPELRHTFRGADIIASQGFDTIQRLAPGIRSILDGWGGSSVPKPSSNDASCDSSIINSKSYNKETAYAMGGVRMNSFSDFMAHMFFDYCQAFADLSAKELPSQAYTKELTFVRFFGRSGQKINMSGIAAIRDNALPTVASKSVSKTEAEANEKIEKMVAGLDITRLLEHLNKDIYQLTENDIEQFLDMCDYVWADESINMKHATLLQTGILYDKLSESKIEECYELLKAGEIEEALKVAGEENVDTEYAKHCGTIVVGVSDAHIRKLLRDPTVRMVIPYHKSGLNPVIARELRIAVYNDYTTVQNTGAIRKGTNSRANLTSEEIKKAYGLKDFAFYDWFGKTIDGKVYDGKATADKYLEWCEKGYYDESVGDYVYYTTKQKGYILASELHKKLTIDPKFSSFVGEENYYKLLEDFDCYNTITGEHSAQGAVDFLRNGLPSDYKTVLMDALTAEQKVHDDFRDHLDNKGLKEEIMEIAKPKTAPKTIEGVKRQLKTTNASFSQEFANQTLDGFGISHPKDFVHVQRQVFATLLGEGFFTNAEKRSRIDINDESGMVIETNKSGIDETFDEENYKHIGMQKKIAKLATIRMLPEVIKEGQLVADNVRNQHNNGSNKQFAYITHTVEVDGQKITLQLDIKKSPQKNKFWVHHVKLIENVSDTPASTDIGTEAGQTIADNGDIITQEQPIVKRQLKNSSNSTRSLLANALETTAQNDIERTKLEQYKSKIDLIESEYAKLAEIKKQANDLRFTKGRTSAETKKMKDLDFEANQIANRINVYDRQLFNLESTTALKNVLQREKELARKKEAQKGKEALAKRREREAKTIRTLMEKNTESRKKAIEGRNKTDMRHKIKSIVSEINTLLLNPTSKKHIKEELRKGVANALSAINMDTVGADERVAMYNDLIAKEKNPDVIAELTKTRDRIQLQGDKLKDKLNTLQVAYEKIKNSDDIELNLAYQEVIHNSIKAVSEKVGDTSIRNMTLEQLEMVYDLFTMIRHTIREANNSFTTKKGETITQMAEAVNDQVREVGGQPYKRNAIVAAVQRVGWTFLKPLVAFRTIGSITFTNMYKELRNGEDTFYNDVKEAQAFIEAQYEKHGYKSWDMKKTKTFTAKSGKSFALTLEQMMTLYAYSRREQAHKHIIEGGIVFEDAMVVEKNKWGVPIKYEVTTKDAFNLSEETFAEIANSLTAEQKAFVDEMQYYLSITMGAKGNEVSMALLGVKLFKEMFYLPIKSSQYYRNFSAEEAGEVKLKSPAFSKETVPHANNPIVIHNFTDLWAEHINDMSMYHSFVLALEDFTRVYNYKTKTDANVETMDTKATLETAYPGVTKYISKFLKDMNGGVRSETVGWAEKLTSLAKKGSVLGSASVAIQQPSAVMRAMAFINPKYFVMTTPESINLVKHKPDWAELKKYAPIAGIKEMGRFDVGMGQGTVDWIQSNKTVMEKGEDILSIAPAFMDEITWVSIWNAVKRETVSKRKDLAPNSDAFLKVAGERFTEVVSLSQVYDSVFSRSDLMRNKSLVAKWITAFMAEPTTTLNMIWDSWVQGVRSGSVKGFAKATSVTGGAIVASIVLNSALKAIVMGMRDDDEDESYIEKYLESFFGDLKDNLNPLTLVPAVKDVISIFNGYDVERMDMALFSDLKKAIDAFDSDNKTAYEKWSGLIGAISAFCGVPFKNVERDVKGAINTIFGEKVETTGAGLINAITEGWTGEEKPKVQNLYDAIISGDQAQIDRVKSQYKDDKAIESAIKQGLRENDPRIKKAAKALASGNVRDYSNTLDAIVAEGHFDEEMVASAIRSEMSAFNSKINDAAEAKNKGNEEEYKKIVRELRDSYKGVYSQDEIVNLVKKAQDEQLATDDDEDVDKATSIYKASDINDAFESGDTDMALEVIDDLFNTKVENYLAEAKKEAEKNGKTFNERKARQEAESKAKSSIRSSMTSYWKPLYKEAYKSGNTAEKERIERILKASGLYGTASEVIKTCREWRTERD